VLKLYARRNPEEALAGLAPGQLRAFCALEITRGLFRDLIQNSTRSFCQPSDSGTFYLLELPEVVPFSQILETIR